MSASSLLKAESLSAGYGDMTVLHDVGLTAAVGTVTAVAGSNGAGKTTLLKTLLGTLAATRGSILLDGQDVTRSSVVARIGLGMGLVPEGRGLFGTMSVYDNLRLGGRAGGLRGHALRSAIDEVLEVFPALTQKLRAPAGSLSGGQQQMVSVGRTLVARPRVVLLDEPSMGLAPKVWADLLSLVRQLADDGRAIVLAEQKIRPVLAMSDSCLVLRRGRVVFDGPAGGEDAERSINDAYMELESTGVHTGD